jgi:nucleoside-diphosphate-sugar epimerase
MDENSKLHVVIGTGPLGMAVMRELAARGRQVRAVNRSGTAEVPADVQVVAGDVSDPTIDLPMRQASVHRVAGDVSTDHGWGH